MINGSQGNSPIYLLATAHINWEFCAADLPPFFRKKPKKWGLQENSSIYLLAIARIN
jgi:hypothetical protein